MIRYAIAAVLTFGATGTAAASTLRVGAEQEYKMPSQALAHAHDGDTIAIEPGTYFDCSLVKQNDLTIEGTGPGVVMTDKTCRGKAILITNGNNITVRNLTLQRARVPDLNGAGIRAQGGNLTVVNARFLDDQDGILSAPNPNATIRIIGSEFVGNGRCGGGKGCAHGIYIGPVAALDVENSRFLDTHAGHNIKSRAASTTVLNCDIEDGPNGSSSYQIDVPNGGTVRIEGNKLEKGPLAQNYGTAIIIGEEGVTYPSNGLVIRNNMLINETGHETTFVRNITATPAQLSSNVFKGGQVIPLAGDGTVR
jgi:Right handed beta helix region